MVGLAVVPQHNNKKEKIYKYKVLIFQSMQITCKIVSELIHMRAFNLFIYEEVAKKVRLHL